MKYKLIIALLVFALFESCKKKVEPPVPTTPATPINAKFAFWVYDVNGNSIQSTSTGNPYIITFSKGNNVVYSIKTDSTHFTINSFKDGGYVYKITDSLNLFSYTQDSIVSKNGVVYFGHDPKNTGLWNSGYNTVLGSIQAKPTFNLLSYFAKDTLQSGIPGLYVKVTAGGTNISGGLLFYFYKNNKVSSNNLYNYGALFNSGFTVSNTNPSFSTILLQYDVSQLVTFFQPGDSLYFAVYPSAVNPQSFDYLAPRDTTGRFQITAIGTQKLVIPYKWQ